MRVPAFISIRVELRSGDGADYSLTFGDKTIKVGDPLTLRVDHASPACKPGAKLVGTADRRERQSGRLGHRRARPVGPPADWLASQTSGTLRAMSETSRATERTERADFQATSDPGLLESADRGEVHLLSYEQLYNLWERQQWATQDIDFTQDRIDWHERIPEEERFQRMYGLSSFFIGEQKVAEELGPMMRAAPTEEMRIFLCTQIADEARHVRFFNRFYDEVGVLEADQPRRTGSRRPART